MAGNNSIQFLRGSRESIAKSSETLKPGQPLYNIDDRYLTIGGRANDDNRLNKAPIACKEMKGYVTDPNSGEINSVTDTTEQWSIKYVQGEGIKFNNDTAWTGDPITSGDTVMTDTDDVIPSAQSTGFQSFAFGGKRFDKGNDNSKKTTTVSGHQSFAAGGGVEVTGNFAAAFGKQSGAYQEACFAVNGAKAGDLGGNGDTFVAAAAFNISNVKGIQCSGFGAAQIDSTSKNTVGSGTVNINNCEGSLINGLNGTVDNTQASFVNTYRGNVRNVRSSLIHISSGNVIGAGADNPINDSVIMSYNNVTLNTEGTLNRVFCIGESNTVGGGQTYIFGRGLTSAVDGQVLLGNFNADSDAPVVIGCGSESKKVSGIELYSDSCKIKTDGTEVTGTLEVIGETTIYDDVKITGGVNANGGNLVSNSYGTTISNAFNVSNASASIKVNGNDFKVEGSGKLYETMVGSTGSKIGISNGSLKVYCAARFSGGVLIGSKIGDNAFHCNSNATFYGMLKSEKAPINSTEVVRLQELSDHTTDKNNPHEVMWHQLGFKATNTTIDSGVCTVATFTNGEPSITNSNSLLCGGIAMLSSQVGGGYEAANVGTIASPVYFEEGRPYECIALPTVRQMKFTAKYDLDTSINLGKNNTIIAVYIEKEKGKYIWSQKGWYWSDYDNSWNINADPVTNKDTTYQIIYVENLDSFSLSS